MSNNRLKNGLLVVSLMVSAALGAAALAGAASNGGSTTTTTPSTHSPSTAPPAFSQAGRQGGLPPQRSDETLLTGETATKVREAALKAVSNGTIERVETDADGHAKYEAHMTKADGSQVTVYVNEQFDVVGTEAGP
jgi:Flp pilus assembly protein TadG